MIKKALKFLFKLILVFVVLSVSLVILYKYIPVHYTPLMGIRQYQSDSPKELRHKWISISQISKDLQLAIICAEDQNFMTHNGFDLEAIEKAYKKNREGGKIRGASTISQQTAKNVFLWPQRSWLRKGLETYFTFLIELFWSKERIYEVYLNSIEMGPGVYGAEAASLYWYKISAKDISQYQAASIAAILPNPLNYKANPPSEYIQKRKVWIVRQMRNYGNFTLVENAND